MMVHGDGFRQLQEWDSNDVGSDGRSDDKHGVCAMCVCVCVCVCVCLCLCMVAWLKKPALMIQWHTDRSC